MVSATVATSVAAEQQSLTPDPAAERPYHSYSSAFAAAAAGQLTTKRRRPTIRAWLVADTDE